jgi:hypothetical protein
MQSFLGFSPKEFLEDGASFGTAESRRWWREAGRHSQPWRFGHRGGLQNRHSRCAHGFASRSSRPLTIPPHTLFLSAVYRAGEDYICDAIDYMEREFGALADAIANGKGKAGGPKGKGGGGGGAASSSASGPTDSEVHEEIARGMDRLWTLLLAPYEYVGDMFEVYALRNTFAWPTSLPFAKVSHMMMRRRGVREALARFSPIKPPRPFSFFPLPRHSSLSLCSPRGRGGSTPRRRRTRPTRASHSSRRQSARSGGSGGRFCT